MAKIGAMAIISIAYTLVGFLLFNKSDLISIVVTLFYTIINYVVHVMDMLMLSKIIIYIPEKNIANRSPQKRVAETSDRRIIL